MNVENLRIPEERHTEILKNYKKKIWLAFAFGIIAGYAVVSLIFWEVKFDLFAIIFIVTIIMYFSWLRKIKRDIASMQVSIVDEQLHFQSKDKSYIFEKAEYIKVKDSKTVLILEDKNISKFNRKMWGKGVVNIPKGIENYEALKTYLRI